ncbi:uncharacterized protein LOC123540314 isoform X2 [Mercenaria mercenaria]|uniref:uncharacterized protein LOC123540314 isoform X2 n=1 Tax=Mercenaria mercenaria TaxID=6596 RepID=UPI00234F4B73|nr:uncharacterized protein LOC123540314 isoform X2 [Mercenaria mercenaria]
MDFKCLSFPRDIFPRFDHTITKSVELQSRYKFLINEPRKKIVQTHQCVTLSVCKKTNETEFPIELGDIFNETVKNRNFESEVHVVTEKNINSFMNSREKVGSTITIFVVDSQAKNEIYKLGQTKCHILVIAEDENVKTELEEEFKTQGEHVITVTNNENVSSEIDNLLERITLAPLKQIGEDCYAMLEWKDSSSETSTGFPHTELSNISRTGNMYREEGSINGLTYAETPTNRRSRYRTERKHISKGKKPVSSAHSSPCRQNGSAVPVDFDLGKRTSKLSEENKIDVSSHISTIHTRSRSNIEPGGIPNGFKQASSNTKCYVTKVERDTTTTTKGKRRKTELFDQTGSSDVEYQSSRRGQIQEKENPERLLEAILALYGMSNVPETERPAVPKHSYKLCNEVFKISPTIKRMGYRYRTFYIYAVKPKCLADEEKRRKQVCSLLKKYGIYRFEIAPCAENIMGFMHVGAEIEVRSPYSLRSRAVREPGTVKGGTLGCFVNMNDGEGQCGLLSKHVSEHYSDVYYVGKGNNKFIGHMLESTNKHQPNGLDISAALMNEHISEEGTMFKDTRQALLKGKLYEYIEDKEDAVCSSGQSVYIYGAKSNPGKGEITMPFVDSGLSSTLIQVEDQVRSDGKLQGHFAEKGDSGSIVCVEDPHKKVVHAISMVMGSPDFEDSPTTRRTYLTIPLSKGLQQLQNNTGKQFKLC